jgi:hypothetical protein
VRASWAPAADVRIGELLTLQALWHEPDTVSQFNTQVVKAWVWGMIEGSTGTGGGSGVKVCCASVCAGVLPWKVCNVRQVSRHAPARARAPDEIELSPAFALNLELNAGDCHVVYSG